MSHAKEIPSGVDESDSLRDRIRVAIDSTDPSVATALLMSLPHSEAIFVPIAVIFHSCKGASFVRDYLAYVEVKEISGVFHINMRQFQAIHSCISMDASRRELKNMSEKYSTNQKLSYSDGKITIKRRKISAKNKEVRYAPQFSYRTVILGSEIFFPVGTNGHNGLSTTRKIIKDIQKGMPLVELLKNYHPNSELLKKLENPKNDATKSGKIEISAYTMKRAKDELITIKQESGAANATIIQAKRLLKCFINDVGKGTMIADVTSDDIRAHLRTVSPRSYNNHLTAVKGLFKWAFDFKIITDNPCTMLKPKKKQHHEVAILSNSDVVALLRAASSLHDGEFLPYAAITLLAGLRPDSEMKQLTWAEINLEDSEIVVRKGKRCTPRTVEMPKNLQLWLQLCDQSRPIFPQNAEHPEEFRNKWAVIRNAAGFKSGIARTKKQKEYDAKLKPWVRDYTRHTAISNFVRQSGDIFKAATWAGNSPSIIRSNYLGRVTGSEAVEFWAIVPDLKNG